jgi:hypothetical protein
MSLDICLLKYSSQKYLKESTFHYKNCFQKVQRLWKNKIEYKSEYTTFTFLRMFWFPTLWPNYYLAGVEPLFNVPWLWFSNIEHPFSKRSHINNLCKHSQLIFLLRPTLFANCNNTFSKWWEMLRMACRRVLSSTLLKRGKETYKQELQVLQWARIW